MTWALISPALRCRSSAPDLSHLLTYYFPAGIRFLFIIAAHKKKILKPNADVPLNTSLPAFILFSRPANVSHHWISCFRGDGRHVTMWRMIYSSWALMVPSHVTWWKRMYCRASAGQDVSVLLFVWCLLFYVPPPPPPALSPSLRTFRHVEIHTTLPAQSKGFPPETTCSSFSLYVAVHLFL